MAPFNPDAAANAYASTASNTVSGPILIVKLYERLTIDIEIAKERIKLKDVKASHEALIHAQRIVRVLRTSLQPGMFRGGYDLLALYETLESELVRANLEKSLEPLTTCEVIVAPLLKAWTGAVANVLAEQAEPEMSDAAVSVG